MTNAADDLALASFTVNTTKKTETNSLLMRRNDQQNNLLMTAVAFSHVYQCGIINRLKCGD
jgi:hypothetical protein